MKISARALFRVARIECWHRTFVSDGEGVKNRPARIAFMTDETISRVLDLSASREEFTPNSGDPDLAYGSVVAIHRDASGANVSRVLRPGEDGDYYLRLDGDEMLPLTGRGMAATRSRLLRQLREGRKLDCEAQNALSGIHGVYDLVAGAPSDPRFPDWLVAHSYHSMICDALGMEIEIGLEPEVLARKFRGDLLRARISVADKDHIEGLMATVGLRDLLMNIGVMTDADGISRTANDHGLEAMSEPEMLEQCARPGEVHEVLISQICASKVEDLSAAFLGPKDLFEPVLKRAITPLSGSWVKSIKDRALQMEGVEKVEIYAREGRDMLAVHREGGGAGIEIYSWPRRDRVQVIHHDTVRHFIVSPEEVPSDEEIGKLADLLQALTQKDWPGDNERPDQNDF